MIHLILFLAMPFIVYFGMMLRPSYLRVPLVVGGLLGMFIEMINAFEYLMNNIL